MPDDRYVAFAEGRLLIFAKAPVPGQVKTRLVPVLDAADAADLYTRLIHETLVLTHRFPLSPVQLWCSPTSTHSVFEACARVFPVTLHVQLGADLGQRMNHAISEALMTADYAVVIGCDCPVLSVKDLWQAFSALRQGYDAVLSPAEDGGYVLLGLRQPVPELFYGIAWGTDRVLPETRLQLNRLGLQCFELPLRWDVDRPADLKRYYAVAGM